MEIEVNEWWDTFLMCGAFERDINPGEFIVGYWEAVFFTK